jgi:hypothetical protein
MQAFLDASPQPERSVEDVIRENTGLRLLSIAVDFSSFSLASLSTSCPRLTHLSFSEFYLPDGGQDQTLHLPMLNTLILNFFCPYESISPPIRIHYSYRHWRLPSLRHLSLKGWVSDVNPDFLEQINGILPRVGPTLQGLLYQLWSLSDARDCILHPLPSSLWDWCPHLHTIQTALKTLLACPKPPPDHPGLIFVPIYLGDIGALPGNIGNLVWPKDLIEEAQNGEQWPIDIVRIPTTWATFHRKLLGIVKPSQSQDGKTSGTPLNWLRYFDGWAMVLMDKKYSIQDRYGVDINQGDGRLFIEWFVSTSPSFLIKQSEVFLLVFLISVPLDSRNERLEPDATIAVRKHTEVDARGGRETEEDPRAEKRLEASIPIAMQERGEAGDGNQQASVLVLGLFLSIFLYHCLREEPSTPAVDDVVNDLEIVDVDTSGSKVSHVREAPVLDHLEAQLDRFVVRDLLVQQRSLFNNKVEPATDIDTASLGLLSRSGVSLGLRKWMKSRQFS